MSPSRTHPTGLDRIIGFFPLKFPKNALGNIHSDGNGRSSDLHPQTHGKRSSRKNVSDHGACQQRDCPGFSPDSLLITTHKPCLRRQEVAANQLRLQRYNKKMNKRLFYLLFYSTSDKIIFHSFPVLFFYFLILSFYSLSILCFLKHLSF